MCKDYKVVNSSFWLFVSIFFAVNAHASVLYVDGNSTGPISPYTDWSMAATNIQDAIDASTDGDQILVTNGLYQTGGKVMAGDLTNRVALNKAVTVQSVNGPWVTTIRGTGATNGLAAVRCTWLTNGAVLIGFTVQGGATRTGGSGDANLTESGGGVWCASSNAIVSHCAIKSNTAAFNGGGAYQGTLKNCLLAGNSTPTYLGFGVVANGIMTGCTVVSNTGAGVAGGMYTNCIVYFNSPYDHSLVGGGTFAFCCTPSPSGIGNISAAPQLAADGIHLTTASPCIGAGAYLVNDTDIFGQGWSNPPSMGCAEWQPAPFVTQPQVHLTISPIGFIVGNSLVAGQPPFSYSWLKDGVLLQDNGHYSSTQSTNLFAKGVSLADAGNYQFVVSNTFGVATSSVVPVVIHAVDVAGVNPVVPYSSWATAATNIQVAINVASAGDIVLVTNGIYKAGGKVMAGDLTNRVAVDKAVTVMSVNGYAATVIQGAWDPASTNGPGAVRCAYLADGAILNGFILQNGATRATGDIYSGGQLESGGGVWCVSTNGIVSNCVLSNNSALYGGGISYGTLNNSLVTLNLAVVYGGGAYSATLNNCTVMNNTTPFFISGAGTYNGITRNSIVVGNYDLHPLFNVDNYFSTVGAPYSYSCTSPTKSGIGNTNVNPQFLDLFHIASTSPCRSAGSTVFASGADLDGESWTNPPSMGCDEVVLANLVGPLSLNMQAYQTNLLVNRYDNFTGIIIGHASRVEWSFGDGPTTTNSGASISHQWPNSGDFSVTFTAYNNDIPAGVSTNTVIHVEPLNFPQLLSALLLTNGFQFQFAAQMTANYTIQYSTNLVPPVAWQTLQTIYYSSGGMLQITDLTVPNGTRFYRVLAQ